MKWIVSDISLHIHQLHLCLLSCTLWEYSIIKLLRIYFPFSFLRHLLFSSSVNISLFTCSQTKRIRPNREHLEKYTQIPFAEHAQSFYPRRLVKVHNKSCFGNACSINREHPNHPTLIRRLTTVFCVELCVGSFFTQQTSLILLQEKTIFIRSIRTDRPEQTV